METVLTRSVAASLCGLLIGSLQPSPARAIDPGYIEAIEADVAEFTSKEFHAPADSAWLGSTGSEAVKLADLEGFSSFLQNKSPGSFIFYKKLPAEYREQLREAYLATGDLDRIKEDIFKYARAVKQ